MKLIPASLEAPEGLEAFLLELGDGENGYQGTEVVRGAVGLRDYLQRQEDYALGINLPAGHVPATTFWLLDDRDEVVGMSRLRHRLTPHLLRSGGHIGYYVRPLQRGRGYGTAILRLTLGEAKKLGIERALLTVNADNLASVRVIEANGGVLEDETLDPDTGKPYRRYWVQT